MADIRGRRARRVGPARHVGLRAGVGRLGHLAGLLPRGGEERGERGLMEPLETRWRARLQMWCRSFGCGGGSRLGTRAVLWDFGRVVRHLAPRRPSFGRRGGTGG